MKYRKVAQILGDNGISFKRNGKGSHKIYEGQVNGKNRVVVLSYSTLNDDVPKGTLGNIAKQSGLPKRLFRS